MGFTAPVTRATDFLVTAAVWNAEHVDNFNTAVIHVIARKTADETVTSSVVLQDDNNLILPVGVNEIWMATWNLIWTASVTGDMKTAFTFPSGATIDYNMDGYFVGGTTPSQTQHITTSPSTALSVAGQGATVIMFLTGRMLYVGGANAGNVTLQWAQDTSDATATTMKTNSTLWAVRLA